MAEVGRGEAAATGCGANIGGCAGGVGPWTDIAAGGGFGGAKLGMGVDRGGGGEAGLLAHVRDTDWGLEVGNSWIGGAGAGGAGVEKKVMGLEKIPALAGGPRSWCGVLGGPPGKPKL